jgi:hypothetical protein
MIWFAMALLAQDVEQTTDHRVTVDGVMDVVDYSGTVTMTGNYSAPLPMERDSWADELEAILDRPRASAPVVRQSDLRPAPDVEAIAKALDDPPPRAAPHARGGVLTSRMLNLPPVMGEFEPSRRMKFERWFAVNKGVLGPLAFILITVFVLALSRRRHRHDRT